MSNTIIRNETAINLFGISARAHNVVYNTESGRILNQKINASRYYKEDGRDYRITAELRFDDQCKNGHETFSITGDIDEKDNRGRYREYSGGCIHDEITKRFPEFEHLIKWHLVSTDGPMHYLANTIYLAGDRDHWGLLKGEKRQIKRGGITPCWHLVAIGQDGEEMQVYELPKSADGEKPSSVYKLEWRPWCTIGEGKERELDAARRVAVWPDATDEELSRPREELEAVLKARLPSLLEQFKAEMLACGFMWPEKKEG